jgi:hypothetical protein
MMPPVEVPAIMSKQPAAEAPPRKRASNSASTEAGKIPHIPPPSMDKIRKGRSAGQGSGSRRRWSVPADRRGGT